MPSVLSLAQQSKKGTPAPKPGQLSLLEEPPAGGGVKLTQVEQALLADALDLWIECGYAITLSRTSDGGAIGLSLMAGDWRKKYYAAHADELTELLERLASTAKIVLDGGPVPPSK